MPRPDATKKLAATAPKTGPSKVLIGASIAAIALVVLVVVLVMQELKKDEIEASKPPAGSASPAQVSVKDDASGVYAYPDKVQEGAPTVDIYTDPQCPYCAQFEQANGKMLDERAKAGAIKLVYHPKTFLDGPAHPGKNSERSVGAMMCAVRADKFIEYQEALFENPPQEGTEFPNASLKAIGTQAGIEGDAKTEFDKCVDDNKYGPFALKMETWTKDKKIQGTPTVRINGKDADLNTVLKDPAAFGKLLDAATTGAAKDALSKMPKESAPAPAGTAPATPAPTAPATTPAAPAGTAKP